MPHDSHATSGAPYSQRFDSLPTYQHYPAMEHIRIACRLLAKPGDMVIYRDAFRWKNDADGHVLSNHFECLDLPTLAEDFRYEIVHDFNHVAVVRKVTCDV